MNRLLHAVFTVILLTAIGSSEKIQVHMIISSHLDAGWVSTFDEYYVGKNTRYGENVRRLYETLIPALEANGDWTYAISEISFFSRWWNEKDTSMQKRVRKLVSNKQIEFVNGGWVANDEATVYYEDIIENFRLGNRWLQEVFGITPTIGWQVDSFGTSATHAALLAQTGYEALYFSRLDHLDRQYRKGNQSLEFMWKPLSPHGETIFTHIFSGDYGPVTYLSRAAWISAVFRGGKLSEKDYNEIDEYLKKEKTYFRTSHLLFPFCGDFYFPARDYPGMQGLVDHFKKRDGTQFQFKFSSLTEFSKDVMTSVDKTTLPTKKGDFFPYIETNDNSWTGFYTSKAMFKRLVRATSQHAQAMNIFAAKTLFWKSNKTETFDLVSKRLTELQEVTSILQHHDAITGTMKEYVKYDYEDMVSKAVQGLTESLQPTFENYLQEVLNEKVDSNQLKLQFVNQFMKDGGVVSLDDFTTSPISGSETGIYTLACFNPGAQRNSLIKIKLPETKGKRISILSQDESVIEPDVICLTNAKGGTECRIYFIDNIGDFAIKLYKIQIQNDELNPISPITLEKNQLLKIYNNAHIEIKEDFGDLIYRHCPTQEKYDDYENHPENCINTNLQIQYGYYKSAAPPDPSPSGAYVFTPEKNSKLIMLPSAKGINAYVGKHITLLQVKRDNMDNFLLFESLNTELPGFEVYTKIYGVPESERGREFILQIKDLEIKNAGRFYVDQNGYYMAERVYGQKEDFTPNNNLEVRQNFYPMTVMTYIKNNDRRLTVMTDRPQGVSSTMDGEIEVMLHRTSVADDNKGVDEAIYEKTRDTKQPINVSTNHYILVTDSTDSNSYARKLQVEQDRPIQYWIFKSENSVFKSFIESHSIESSDSSPNIKFSLMTPALGEAYLTLQNINDIEVETNICEKSLQKSNLFDKICFDCNVSILSSEETTWNTIHSKNKEIGCGDSVKLLPMEIRTFKLSLSSSSYVPTSDKNANHWFIYICIALYLIVGILLLPLIRKDNQSLIELGKKWCSSKLVYLLFIVFWAGFLIKYFFRKKEEKLLHENHAIQMENLREMMI